MRRADVDLSAFAVWRPSVRGTSWRLVQPAVVGLSVSSVIALALVRVVPPIVILPGTAGCFLIGSFLVLPWELRFTATREVVFADSWLGVAHGGDLDRVAYPRVGDMWVIGGARYPMLTLNQRAPETGYIHIERADGLPFSFPRVLTYTQRDRSSFIDFVRSQAADRGRPLSKSTSD